MELISKLLFKEAFVVMIPQQGEVLDLAEKEVPEEKVELVEKEALEVKVALAESAVDVISIS